MFQINLNLGTEEWTKWDWTTLTQLYNLKHNEFSEKKNGCTLLFIIPKFAISKYFFTILLLSPKKKNGQYITFDGHLFSF